MPKPIIEVEGLSKKYRLGAIGATTLRDDLSRLYHRLRHGEELEKGEFWALRDVTFSLEPGEVLGIIGRNGAGKSTLLKILSRITEPTEGMACLRGRISSMLEVGTGFHPDLTGRENVFLNGAILGMMRQEIASKFDSIVSFAEIGTFIDTPVKHYSSGMRLRLAFAVSAFLSAEIILIDEVLAVGDHTFQAKCIRLIDRIREEGRTVLLVSHDISLIGKLCDKAILLESGRLRSEGPVQSVLQDYCEPRNKLNSWKSQGELLPEELECHFVSITTKQHYESVELRVHIEAKAPLRAAIEISLEDNRGHPCAFGSVGFFRNEDLIPIPKGNSEWTLQFSTRSLAVGTYSMQVDLAVPMVHYLHRCPVHFSFEVTHSNDQDRSLSLQKCCGAYVLPVVLHQPPQFPRIAARSETE